MSNINKIVLLGKVTKDPETKFGMDDSSSFSNFVMAVERPTRQDGQQETDFIPIVAWGKNADYIAEHIKVDQLVLVEGRIQVRTIEENGQREWITEVVANNVKTVSDNGPAVKTEEPSQVEKNTEQTDSSNNPFDNNTFTEDDIPF